jgi:flavin reductase (DIM6/NTAB) family NADH-FMN oxidoreductase RutF
MNGRVELRLDELAPRSVYPFLTAALIPRAIAWVSTRSAAGIDNVAPHSFTTVAGIDPATLCFTSVGHKDTLTNVRATGEFVVNIGTESLLAAMNDSATDFPPDVDEFAAVGLVREASQVVAAPRVAAAPIAFECRASGEHEVGQCVMVFGEVVHIAVSSDVLGADGLPNARSVAPLARLGRNEWATLGEVLALDRIRHVEWQAGRRSE